MCQCSGIFSSLQHSSFSGLKEQKLPGSIRQNISTFNKGFYNNTTPLRRLPFFVLTKIINIFNQLLQVDSINKCPGKDFATKLCV